VAECLGILMIKQRISCQFVDRVLVDYVNTAAINSFLSVGQNSPPALCHAA